MFWEAVSTGLGVLTYWQTYVAVLLFLALSMGPMLFTAFLDTTGHAEVRIGCFSMLVSLFFHAFALVVFVLTMSPIILGLSHEAAWSFPWALTVEAPWVVAKLLGFMVLGAIILAFVPIIGKLQSLQTFFLGSFALMLVVELVGSANPVLTAKNVTFWPGFWLFLGLLVVGSILARVGIMLAALLATAIGAKGEGIMQLLIFPIAAAFGFIPVFIYGAWLGAQLRFGQVF
ncbi:MAG: hypothetical protein R6U98_23340 [Pirellulaceae bacterium]